MIAKRLCSSSVLTRTMQASINIPSRHIAFSPHYFASSHQQQQWRNYYRHVSSKILLDSNKKKPQHSSMVTNTNVGATPSLLDDQPSTDSKVVIDEESGMDPVVAATAFSATSSASSIVTPSSSSVAGATTTTATTSTTTTVATKTLSDEDKDAKLLFDQVMQELIQESNGVPLKFPKEIIFLLGAPGSGKGTMTMYIQKTRGLTAKPIVVSDILQGAEFKEIKAKGALVGDGIVLRALFKELLRNENEMGVIVDGFPRTEIQARCLSLLWDWMEEQRVRHGRAFRRPKFRITVLYIPEELSVERQLARGRMALEHNERINQTGLGHMIEVRPTDLSEDFAKSRYKYFKDHIWKSVKLLQPKFNYNFIDASGVKQQVAENVKNEMKYQSSLELGKETFDMITTFPTAERLTRHARQSLVRRLDTYALEHTTLFKQVLDVLHNEFLHIMQRQSLTGAAIIRTQNPLLNEKLAVDMMLDILLERGYKVVLDQERVFRPIKLNGTIIEGHEVKIWRFQIAFDVPQIRG